MADAALYGNGLYILLAGNQFLSGSGYVELKHFVFYQDNTPDAYFDANPDSCFRVTSGCEHNGIGAYKYYSY